MDGQLAASQDRIEFSEERFFVHWQLYFRKNRVAKGAKIGFDGLSIGLAVLTAVGQIDGRFGFDRWRLGRGTFRLAVTTGVGQKDGRFGFGRGRLVHGTYSRSGLEFLDQSGYVVGQVCDFVVELLFERLAENGI